MKLEFFSDDEEVLMLQAQVDMACGAGRIEPMLFVAWLLRHSTSKRSLEIAAEIEQLVGAGMLCETEGLRAYARLQLLRCEIHCLRGNYELVPESLNAARTAFATLCDCIGLGDCEWLAASNFMGLGNRERRDDSLESAKSHYAIAGDPLRLMATMARTISYSAFFDPKLARVQWKALIATNIPLHPFVQGWVLSAEGIIESMAGNHGAAARAQVRSYEAAMRCGNLTLAVNSASNAGAAFDELNDLSAALDWFECSLALARKINNPAQIASPCARIGDVLRRLNRATEARARLQEARDSIAHLPTHPVYLAVLSISAALALDTGNAAESLEWAERCEVRAIATRQRGSLADALRQQARALGQLARPEQAIVKAEASLALARELGNTSWQIGALRVMAELHRQYSIPNSLCLVPGGSALQYMQQAIASARTVDGLLVSPELLEETAADFAGEGDFAQAYTLVLEAKQARVKMLSREASDRSIAMELHYEFDQLQAEKEHHKQLAEFFRNANFTLEELGKIGRDLTANLDAKSVYGALERHVHRLLDATNFAIFLLNVSNQTLVSALLNEAGESLPQQCIELDHPTANVARCAREQVEIVLELDEDLDAMDVNLVPGTLPTLSLLFAPLTIAGRLLGVMTIQSAQPKAYGEREIAIFRTLCAYGAIALRNGQSHNAAEQALKASEALKSAIMDHATVALITAHAQGDIVEFNPAATTMFGLTRAQALGSQLSELIAPQRLQPDDLFLRCIGVEAPPILGERISLSAVRCDGQQFPIEMLLWRTDVNDKVFYTASITDMSDRKAMDEKMAQQRDALRQSEKLSVMGNLLAGVAHELNNPLAIVMGRASLLREKVMDDPMDRSVAGDLDRIYNAAERCGRIVRTFLNMARQRPVNRSIVNLHDLVRAAIDMLAYNYRSHRIELRMDLASTTPFLNADGDQIGQIVLNMLINAQQALASHEGSRRVHINTGLEVANGGKFVWMRVADSGSGISADVRSRLFEPFFTTKTQEGGNGLGLSMSRSIAREHGGELMLETPVKGLGAAFILRLPLSHVQPTTSAPMLVRRSAPQASAKRILVVDDEPEMVAVMGEMLVSAGYEVLTASSGRLALEILTTQSVSVTLCDLNMPDMDGPTFLRLIRIRAPLCAKHLIFMTGDSLSAEIIDFLSLSDYLSLEKPFSKSNLIDCVQRAHDNQIPASSITRSVQMRSTTEGVLA